MSSLDILSMVVRNLLKRKLRTMLTVLGVIMGCAAIIIMISFGLGIDRSIQEQMKNMGDMTRIEVYNGEGYYGWVKDALVIDGKFVEEIEKIDGIQAVSPYVQTYLTAVSGRYTASISIYGVNPGAMEAFGYVAAEGRLLEEGDKMQIVYGSNVPMNFTSPRDAGRYSMYMYSGMDMGGRETSKPKVNVLEDRVQASFVYGFGQPDYQPDPDTQGKIVKPYKLDGVGVLAQSDTDWETQYYCFMSVQQVEQMIADQMKYEKSMSGGGSTQERYGYERVLVKAVDVKTVDKVIEGLIALGIKEENIYSPRESVSSLQEMLGSLQMLLGGIGAVSLFVAAIGIANTMVMSIYERTREIGIMKVIGASVRDVRRMFLTEAAMIGVFGGLFGVALSLLVSYIVNTVGIPFFDMLSYGGGGENISYVPFWLCGLGVVFSAFIGLISGYFPARRATKLSALTAIRSE